MTTYAAGLTQPTPTAFEAVIKWVDNFIFLCYSSGMRADSAHEYSYSSDLIWKIVEELGWPWAPSKFVGFLTVFMYIGFWWDLAAKRVELPEKKKAKYLECISDWTSGSLHSVKDTERIIGTLNHVCLVVPEGRSRMVALYKFRGGFRAGPVGCSEEVRHKVSAGVSEDVNWWRRCLQDQFVWIDIIHPLTPADMRLFVNASTGWGIGLILDGRWLAWQLKEGWNSEGREIGWVEMMAVELAVHTLITGKYSNRHIIVHSDNKGVVGALGAGRSWGTQQNAILREIVKLIQGHKLWISTIWVPTTENMADAPSRGVFPGKSSLYAFPPKIPFHLEKFVHRAVDYHNPRIA